MNKECDEYHDALKALIGFCVCESETEGPYTPEEFFSLMDQWISEDDE